MGLFDDLFRSIKTAVTDKASPQTGEGAKDDLLRDGGIYVLTWRREDGSLDHYMCLRFYPRMGKVIECSFSSRPSPAFFTIADRQFRSAEYARQGNSISFDTVSPYGRVEYHGVIRADSILMSWHSCINGRDFHDETYVFMSDDEVRQALRPPPRVDLD